jgi:hypothetical protein
LFIAIAFVVMEFYLLAMLEITEHGRSILNVVNQAVGGVDGNHSNTPRIVILDRARRFRRVDGRGSSIRVVRRTQIIEPSALLALNPRRNRSEKDLARRG